MAKYQRLDGESDDALIFRVCRDKERIGTWQDVSDILNPLLGTDYGESTFRKKYASFTQMFNANRDIFSNSETELEKIREEERRLQIEKVKFRDERNAWSAQNRLQARAEAKLDNIEDALLDFGRIYFPERKIPAATGSGKTILVMLSDFHIGATFDNYWGKYNSNIAEDRLGVLLKEVKEIAKRHGADQCVVSLGGDLVSGKIHRTIQVTNRENVIDQIKRAAELVTSFCYELTDSFNLVQLVSVDGNHSRIDSWKDAIHEDRLDALIPYCVNLALDHIENFYYNKEANIDSGIALIHIEDKYYLSVHGDYDRFTKDGMQSLMSMVKVFPYCILRGHEHRCAVDEVNGVKMVMTGSLCGSGDQFCIEQRIRGKASQMVCVCSNKGIEAFYPVELEVS